MEEQIKLNFSDEKKENSEVACEILNKKHKNDNDDDNDNDIDNDNDDSVKNEAKETDGKDKPVVMSKNGLKRLRRKENYKAKKKEKREQLKLVKRQNREERGDKPIIQSSEEELQARREERIALKQEASDKFNKACQNNFAIIIDCSWEHIHNESSLCSLNQQVTHCYAQNRKHSHPSYLYVTGIGNTYILLS